MNPAFYPPGLTADRIGAALRTSDYFHDQRLWATLSRPGMLRWSGALAQETLITVDELSQAIAQDAVYATAERDELQGLLESATR